MGVAESRSSNGVTDAGLWLLIAEKLLIHRHILTLHHKLQRNNDQRMGAFKASTTLMKKFMILKSVSMPTERQIRSLKRRFHSKMAWKTLNLDDQHNNKGSSYSSSKSSRVYCCVHKEYEASTNTSYNDMRNLKKLVLLGLKPNSTDDKARWPIK